MEYYDEVVEIKSQNKQQHPGNSRVTAGEAGILSILDDEKMPQDGSVIDEDFKSQGRPTSSLLRKRQSTVLLDTHLSDGKLESFGGNSSRDVGSAESDSEDTDTELNNELNKQFIVDHKEWEKLNVSQDIKEIFQFIVRYSPQKIDIDYILQPFIPEYIPAVGDIDAFLKVLPPAQAPPDSDGATDEVILKHIEKLGLEILDEPSGQQSEPALLHMKLRSVSTQPRTPGGPPPSVSKSQKDIEQWIQEIQSLHVDQTYPQIMHNRPVQDIDALMIEWPVEMEQILNNFGFPNADLNCSLKFYIEMICAMFDIAIGPKKQQSDYIFALFTLFNLYMAIKNPID